MWHRSTQGATGGLRAGCLPPFIHAAWISQAQIAAKLVGLTLLHMQIATATAIAAPIWTR